MFELLLLAATVAVYLGASALRARWTVQALNPTLISIVMIGGALLVTGGSYARYDHANRLLSDLLTPAVVALAVPLHRNREILRRHLRPVLVGGVVGVLTGAIVGATADALLHMDRAWSLAAMTRSATSPIAIALAGELHGQPSLAAVTSIVTGVLGATIGPGWLTRLRVDAPIARGMAHGINCHGVGTARMIEEGHLSGAASAVGMALGGTALALLLPLVWH